MQKRSDPSGFFTNSTGAAYGLWLGVINPASNNSSIVYLISNCSAGDYLYAALDGGVAPGSVSMACSSPSPRFGGSCFGSSAGKTSA